MQILAILIKYWQPLLAAIVTAGISYAVHSLDINRIENKHRVQLEEQAAALIEQCEKDKRLTTEVSNGYQNSISILNRKLADAKRLRASAATCVSVTGTASGRNASAGGAESVRQNAVAADSLIDYAGEAEKYRLQLISCQKFIRKVWESKE